MRGHVAVSLFALAVACSSTSASPDAAVTDAGAEASPAQPAACGPAPHVKIDGTVEEFQLGPFRKKEGVKVTGDICPGVSVTSDSEGKVVMLVTKGKPFYLMFDHPDDLPMMFPEWSRDADFTGATIMIPTGYRDVMAPSLTADSTFIAVQVSGPTVVTDGGTADPCSLASGVKIEVPGRPEAKVTYYTEDAIPKPDASLTMTGKLGLASVTGLADGTTVDLVGTKAGCTVSGKHDGFTGRAMVKKGRYAAYLMQLTK